MPFPDGLTLVTVRCKLDGPGRIRFEALYPLQGPTDNSIVRPFQDAQETDEDGLATFTLPATDDPGWTPVDWSYVVVASWDGGSFRGTAQFTYTNLTAELADVFQPDGAAEQGVTYATLAQLEQALDGVAELPIETSDVTGLDAALAGKQDAEDAVTLPIATSDVTGLDAALSGKQPAGSYAAAVHQHAITDVTDLTTQLDGKLDVPPEPYLTAADTANLVSYETLQEELADKSDRPVETVYTTPGAASYADPGATCKYLDVTIVAGGGGGGSGRRGAATSVRAGGAGGGGGGLSRALIPYSSVTFPVTIAVGAAGTSGSAISANDTNGNPGGAGGGSSFGTYLRASGGGGGGGGVAGAATGGFSGGGTTFGQTGASSSATGALPGNPSSFASGPSAGGAGGGITTGDSPSNGGAGGAGMNSTAATAGVVGGAAAGTGAAQPANSGLPGNGGAGGAASILTAAGTGGDGGRYGAGGGGGGGSLNGNASGAGGSGAAGIVRVVAFF